MNVALTWSIFNGNILKYTEWRQKNFPSNEWSQRFFSLQRFVILLPTPLSFKASSANKIFYHFPYSLVLCKKHTKAQEIHFLCELWNEGKKIREILGIYFHMCSCFFDGLASRHTDTRLACYVDESIQCRKILEHGKRQAENSEVECRSKACCCFCFSSHECQTRTNWR